MTVRDPENPPPIFDALHIPPLALERGGTEVLRAVVIDGDLHLSIRRSFEEPETWGMLLADLTRHIGRIYARETNMSEQDIVEKVCETFAAEMEEPTDPGSTSAIS
jgi:hypothetical protein